jgi:hypothetical protein
MISPIFDRLQRERPLDCNTFLHTKLHAITGDVTSPMLGISKQDQQLLSQCVHITIHCAATVQFNESLDVAVEMNCLGAMYAFDFIQTYCPLVQVHCHVSTAYVNSNLRQQLHIQEELYPLDFDPEEAVESITKASATELDRLHVNLIGTYPNTYALTKSMAEHLITKRSINIPLVIYRPTIIGAAWKEPVPGWIDQIAGAGAIFLACGMGVLTMLPGDPRNIADIVPVDFCVNSLLISCYTQLMKTTMTNGMPKPLIVHCGTSDPRQNPLKWRIPLRIIPEYWQKNPPKRQLFPAKFQMYPTHQQFQMAWFFSYAMPSSVYSTVANRIGQTKHVKNAARLWQLTWRARNLVEIFKPFTENQWIFVTNTINNVLLAQSVSFSSSSSLWWSLDTKEIAWERYLFNFCVGLKKYILQEEVIDVDIEGVNHTELALSTNRMLTWDPDHHAISFPGLFSDLSWAYTSSRKPGYTHSGLLGRLLGLTGWKEGMNHEASHVPRPHIDSVSTLRNEVLESSNVQKAIEQEALLEGKSIDEINQKAMDILNEMAAQIDYTSVRKMGWFLRKVCRQMYEKIHVDEKGFTHLRDLVRACHEKNGHCIILLPTHRSYGDFLLMSYLFFAYNLPVPYIAAGKDFLQMGPWLSQLLRESGAFFIERSFKQKELLYTAIFQEYTQYLLTRGHLIEFFIEGKRSRSGKQLHPKFGLLHTILETFLTGKIQNVNLIDSLD